MTQKGKASPSSNGGDLLSIWNELQHSHRSLKTHDNSAAFKPSSEEITLPHAERDDGGMTRLFDLYRHKVILLLVLYQNCMILHWKSMIHSLP